MSSAVGGPSTVAPGSCRRAGRSVACLLIGAGLFGRSLYNIKSVKAGFERESDQI